MFNNFFLEYRAVYEIMWKNIVMSGRAQRTLWCMRVVRLIPQATNTLSEYVTLIGFLLELCLHECT